MLQDRLNTTLELQPQYKNYYLRDKIFFFQNARLIKLLGINVTLTVIGTCYIVFIHCLINLKIRFSKHILLSFFFISNRLGQYYQDLVLVIKAKFTKSGTKLDLKSHFHFKTPEIKMKRIKKQRRKIFNRDMI